MKLAAAVAFLLSVEPCWTFSPAGTRFPSHLAHHQSWLSSSTTTTTFLASTTVEETTVEDLTLSNTTTATTLSRTGHDHEAWKRMYTSCKDEIKPTVLEFADLPADFPIGTLYRNGHVRHLRCGFVVGPVYVSTALC